MTDHGCQRCDNRRVSPAEYIHCIPCPIACLLMSLEWHSPSKELMPLEWHSPSNTLLKCFVHKQFMVSMKTLSYICCITIKGALDKYNMNPQLPKKSWDFYTIRSVGMGNDRMLSFTF